MAVVPPIDLDATDVGLLAALQSDGRQSIAELGRPVSMSAGAVAERVRRLEETGVITGYRAVVDPERLGYARWSLERRPFLASAAPPAPRAVSALGARDRPAE